MKQYLDAISPKFSAYVASDAGTGKTKILVDRVINLMLAGIDFKKILCITFTNASANEMLERILQKLQLFNTQDDLKIKEELEKIIPKYKVSRYINKSKELLNLYLEKPIKVQTIHAFCQNILKTFPLEAEVSINFSILEHTTEVIKEIYLNILQKAKNDPNLYQIISDLSSINILEVCKKIISLPNINYIDENSEMLKSNNKCITFYYLDLLKNIEAILQISNNNDLLFINQELKKLDPFAIESSTISVMESVIMEKLFDFFLTKEMLPRKKVAKIHNIKTEIFIQACQENLLFIKEIINFTLFVKNTKNINKFAKIVKAEYQKYKAKNNKLDYNDLIIYTEKLLTGNFKEWVLYKLDGGIDHILLDEAQDTSTMQWSVIHKVISASIDNEKEKTMFIVGDEKQSIYSFQGSNVADFINYQNLIKESLQINKKKFIILNLQKNYRCGIKIINTVNSFFNHLKSKFPNFLLNEAKFDTKANCKHYGSIEVWEHNVLDDVQDRDNASINNYNTDSIFAKNDHNNEVNNSNNEVINNNNGSNDNIAANKNKEAISDNVNIKTLNENLKPIKLHINNLLEKKLAINNSDHELKENLEQDLILEKIINFIQNIITNKYKLESTGKIIQHSDIMIISRTRDKNFYKLNSMLINANLKSSNYSGIDIKNNKVINILFLVADFALAPDDNYNLIAILKNAFDYNDDEILQISLLTQEYYSIKEELRQQNKNNSSKKYKDTNFNFNFQEDSKANITESINNFKLNSEQFIYNSSIHIANLSLNLNSNNNFYKKKKVKDSSIWKLINESIDLDINQYVDANSSVNSDVISNVNINADINIIPDTSENANTDENLILDAKFQTNIHTKIDTKNTDLISTFKQENFDQDTKKLDIQKQILSQLNKILKKNTIINLQDIIKNQHTLDLLTFFIETCNILGFNTHENEDTLLMFFNLIHNFTSIEKVHSLQNFVSYALGIELKYRTQNNSNEVQLSTIHGVKGLEAGIVILLDNGDLYKNQDEILLLNDFIFVRSPSFADCVNIEAIKLRINETAYQEYLRLFYVAITRAKDKFIICTTNKKSNEKSYFNLFTSFLKTNTKMNLIKTFDQKYNINIYSNLDEKKRIVSNPKNNKDKIESAQNKELVNNLDAQLNQSSLDVNNLDAQLNQNNIDNNKDNTQIKDNVLQMQNDKNIIFIDAYKIKNNTLTSIFNRQRYQLQLKTHTQIYYGILIHKIFEDLINLNNIEDIKEIKHKNLLLLPKKMQINLLFNMKKIFASKLFTKIKKMHILTEINVGYLRKLNYSKKSSANDKTTDQTNQNKNQNTKTESEKMIIDNQNNKIISETIVIVNENNEIASENKKIGSQNNKIISETIVIVNENNEIASENKKIDSQNNKIISETMAIDNQNDADFLNINNISDNQVNQINSFSKNYNNDEIGEDFNLESLLNCKKDDVLYEKRLDLIAISETEIFIIDYKMYAFYNQNAASQLLEYKKIVSSIFKMHKIKIFIVSYLTGEIKKI